MERIEIIRLDRVDSTNSYAKREFAVLPDGALVVAESQSAGRGRLGRGWLSPPGVNIYASLVMKEPIGPVYSVAVVALAALSMIREVLPDKQVFIKWPNDIYVGKAKIAGALAESTGVADGRISGLVVGIGVNVNMSEEALKAVNQSATSMMAEKKAEIDRNFVLERLAFFLKRYYINHSNSPAALFDEWKRENILIGRTIELTASDQKVYRGTFADVTADGQMLFRTEDGEEKVFSSGDVRINRNTFA